MRWIWILGLLISFNSFSQESSLGGVARLLTSSSESDTVFRYLRLKDRLILLDTLSEQEVSMIDAKWIKKFEIIQNVETPHVKNVFIEMKRKWEKKFIANIENK